MSNRLVHLLDFVRANSDSTAPKAYKQNSTARQVEFLGENAVVGSGRFGRECRLRQ